MHSISCFLVLRVVPINNTVGIGTTEVSAQFALKTNFDVTPNWYWVCISLIKRSNIATK